MKHPIIIILFCFSLVGCSHANLSKKDAQEAIENLYSSQNAASKKIKITKIGDNGAADLEAPGSHDDYWLIQYTTEETKDIGPIKATAEGHYIAKVWKNKLGQWKAGLIERDPSLKQK